MNPDGLQEYPVPAEFFDDTGWNIFVPEQVPVDLRKRID